MVAIETLVLTALLLAQAPAKAQARSAMPDARSAQSAPAKPASKVPDKVDTRAVPPRRAVHQVIDGMPAPVYAPRLTPPVSITAPTPLSPVAPGPAVISRCDAGGCNDTGGARYNGASGTLLSPQGRPCTTVAGLVNCQ